MRFCIVSIGSLKRWKMTKAWTQLFSGGRGNKNISWRRGNFHVVIRVQMFTLGYSIHFSRAIWAYADCVKAQLLAVASFPSVRNRRGSVGHAPWMRRVYCQRLVKSNPFLLVQPSPQGYAQSYVTFVETSLQSIVMLPSDIWSPAPEFEYHKMNIIRCNIREEAMKGRLEVWNSDMHVGCQYVHVGRARGSPSGEEAFSSAPPSPKTGRQPFGEQRSLRLLATSFRMQLKQVHTSSHSAR